MNKNTLKQYQTIKSPLLKEWDGESFERINKHINYMLFANFRDFINIEHGHTEGGLYYSRQEQMADIFGLPYTSSGDFAGVWNTNTQTVTKYGKRLYFRGVAISENKETVIIFNDEKENYFYFYEYEFIHYQEHEQRRERAKSWGEFVKASNTLKNKCIEILKPYTGKPYGEKTAQKIGDQLREIAGGLGLRSAWLDSGRYGQGLKTYSNNNQEKRYYFNFLDESNKITEPREHNGEPPKDAEECDTLAEFDKAGELVEKMKKKAGELLAMVEEFKKHASRANFYPKQTKDTYKLDLENLSRGRIDWEG